MPYLKSSKCKQYLAYLLSFEMYTQLHGPDGMLLEKNSGGKGLLTNREKLAFGAHLPDFTS